MTEKQKAAIGRLRAVNNNIDNLIDALETQLKGIAELYGDLPDDFGGSEEQRRAEDFLDAHRSGWRKR